MISLASYHKYMHAQIEYCELRKLKRYKKRSKLCQNAKDSRIAEVQNHQSSPTPSPAAVVDDEVLASACPPKFCGTGEKHMLHAPRTESLMIRAHPRVVLRPASHGLVEKVGQSAGVRVDHYGGLLAVPEHQERRHSLDV